MGIINTYIFMEVEKFARNKNKIEKLHCISVSRRDLEREYNNKSLPPMGKLSLSFKLEDDNESSQPIFKNSIDLINEFIDKPKPVCLVAQSGNKSYFKLIKSEYEEANRRLPDDLLSVDFITVYQQIKKDKEKLKASTSNGSTSSDQSEDWIELNDEEKDKIFEILGNFSKIKEPRVKRSRTEEQNSADDNGFERLYEQLLKKKFKKALQNSYCIRLLECVLAVKREFMTLADDKYKRINKYY